MEEHGIIRVRQFHQDDQLQVIRLYREAMLSYTLENSIPEIPPLCRKFVEGKCGPGGDMHDINQYFLQQGPPSNFFVAINDRDEIIGCVGAIPSSQWNQAEFIELVRMCVANSYRGSGVGNILLKAFEDWATSLGFKKINLNTLDGMLPAVKFYMKNDFKLVKSLVINPRRNKKKASNHIVNSVHFVKELFS
jgi:N-acetylglutamate synthase-like GNAT family acetyltransferase